MTRNQRSIGWAIVTVLGTMFGTGCSRSNNDELSKVRGELEALRTEIIKVKAEHQAFKEDLEKLKTTGNTRPDARDDRGKASLAARFQAAMALQIFNQQQDAFAGLALDAAKLGDAGITKNCIGKLQVVSQQQDVTYKSALRLAQAGEAESALALARSLQNVSQQ